MTESVSNLRNRYPGETCWVVGKGPSLEYLTRNNFGSGPVIALNEAIVKVEQLGLSNPTYSMQKDLICTEPKNAALIVHEAETADGLPDYRPRFMFNNEQDFGLKWNTFSSIVAANIARLMGCAKVVFISHDACVTGDDREWLPDGIKENDPSLPYFEQSRIQRQYLEALDDIQYEFTTPFPVIYSSVSTLQEDNVLVACPTYQGKAYSLESYIKAYNNFAYPHKGIFMVDNTGNDLKYYEHLQSVKVPCDRIPAARDWQTTFAMSWKRILRAAKEGNYRWVASIEADNICPPLTLDILLNVAGYMRAVHVAHSYFWHQITIDHHGDRVKTSRLIGLGCNLILTELLEAVFAQEKWPTDSFEAEIYEYPKRHSMPMVEIHNLIDVRHLDAPHGAEYFQFDREDIPEFSPEQSANRLDG